MNNLYQFEFNIFRSILTKITNVGVSLRFFFLTPTSKNSYIKFRSVYSFHFTYLKIVYPF